MENKKIIYLVVGVVAISLIGYGVYKLVKKDKPEEKK